MSLSFAHIHRQLSLAALVLGFMAAGCASGTRSEPASSVEPESPPAPYRVIETSPRGAAVDRPLRAPEAPLPVAPESTPAREPSPDVAPAEVSAPVAADIPYGGSRSLIGTTAGASPATALLSSTAEKGPFGVTVEIRGDGALSYSAFRLTEPPRLVIDFQGVENRLGPAEQVFGIGRLGRIRSAVFRPPPSPVVRVVLDLAGAGGVAVEDVDRTLRLTLLP